MTQHRGLEHRSQADLKYGDESPPEETQVAYPGARQKPDWTENDRILQFIDHLKSLNEPLAGKIDQRLDLRSSDDEFAKHVAASFNQVSFPSSSERYEAAQELAKQIFRPAWKGVDPPVDFTQAETHREAQTTEEKLDKNGAVSELMYRQYLFAESLYQDEPDSKLGPLYHLQMENTLREPLTYPKQDEPDYQDKLFDWLKENRYTFGPAASLGLAEIHLAQSRDHAFEYSPEPDRNVRTQLIETTWSATQVHHQKLEEAISQNDVESFKKILEEIPRRDRELCREMKENTGFTNILDEERPKLSHSFNRLDQAQTFAGQMNWNAVAYQDPACVENPDIRATIDLKINDLNRELENQQKTESEHPELSDWWFNDYDRLHDIAKTLDYLTRPKDPDFWKMVDHQDGITEEILTGYAVESATHVALDAINEGPSNEEQQEAALGILRTISNEYTMKIRSDIEREDLGSYQNHMRQIDEQSEAFAKAMLADPAKALQEFQPAPATR